MNQPIPVKPLVNHDQSHEAGNSTNLAGRPDNVKHLPLRPVSIADASRTRLGVSGLSEVRLSSLKVLVTTMLNQIERLERQLANDGASELNLQHEVHQFEAALIQSALARTGGRQRRAAKLLGVKVTTLNTKIKRHKLAEAASQITECKFQTSGTNA